MMAYGYRLLIPRVMRHKVLADLHEAHHTTRYLISTLQATYRNSRYTMVHPRHLTYLLISGALHFKHPHLDTPRATARWRQQSRV